MFSSFRLRSFLMAFTSAFLAFLLFWMAVLMLAHPSAALSNVQPSADSQDSFYLPGESDCMTLLLCEQRQDPQLFLLMRFQPVRGSIFLFAFPRQMLLQLDGVREPVGNIFASHGIQGVRTALEQSFSIPCDRYLMLPRSAFPQLLEAFGPTRLHLDRDVTLTVNSVVQNQFVLRIVGVIIGQIVLYCYFVLHCHKFIILELLLLVSELSIGLLRRAKAAVAL